MMNTRQGVSELQRQVAFSLQTFWIMPTIERESPENFLRGMEGCERLVCRTHAHLRENEFEMEASSEVKKHFQTLDDVLYNAASSELERIRSINEILEETNE